MTLCWRSGAWADQCGPRTWPVPRCPAWSKRDWKLQKAFSEVVSPSSPQLTLSGLHFLRKTNVFYVRVSTLNWFGLRHQRSWRSMTEYPLCGWAESRGAPLHLATAVMSSGPAEDAGGLGLWQDDAQLEAAGLWEADPVVSRAAAELALTTRWISLPASLLFVYSHSHYNIFCFIFFFYTQYLLHSFN